MNASSSKMTTCIAAHTQQSHAKPSLKAVRLFNSEPLFRGCVIPLRKPTEIIKRHGRTRTLGKAPLHFNWTKRQYLPDDVETLVVDGHNFGYRIPPGVMVVDVDPRNGGNEGFKALCAKLGYDFKEHRKHKTGSDGWHIFCMVPDNFRALDTIEGYPGVEFKCVGRQVVLPGSVHPDTGKMYKIEKTGEFLSAPPKLLRLAKLQS
jgi:hypothetical protein